MSTLKKIIDLCINLDIRVSEHGYNELANDDLTAREVVSGVLDAVLIEDYPDYKKGASVLVLQRRTKKANPFMSSGEFPKVMKIQPF